MEAFFHMSSLRFSILGIGPGLEKSRMGSLNFGLSLFEREKDARDRRKRDQALDFEGIRSMSFI